jgi:hypothetical protein
MSIRHYKGYWTVFSGDMPIVSCGSFQSAFEAVQS